VKHSRLFTGASQDWYIDSAATRHMCSSREMFSNIRFANTNVTVANRQIMPCEGLGGVVLDIDSTRVTLTEVMLVPDVSCNLISVSRMADRLCYYL